MAELMCAPGDLIKQRYRIEEPLGRGSFAQVFRATDTVLGRPVAVKVMSPRVKHAAGTDRAQKERELVVRFHNEARAVAVLSDVHSVAIYDFGSRPDGVLFMVQEFIPGKNIREILKESGPFDAIRVARIMKGACQSLQEAHAYGLMHRDIKPENLMVFEHMGDPDHMRVVDFGIAKALEQGNDLTAAGHLVGTPRYVAPERIKQQDLTPASDLYSLGCCAYYMLTGREIYESLDTMAILRAHVAPGDEVLPAEAQVPPELRAIINKLLAKELDARWAVAGQVIEALDHFLIAHRVATDPKFADIGAPSDSHAATQMLASVPGVAPVGLGSASPGFDQDGATEVLRIGDAAFDAAATLPRMEPLRTRTPGQQLQTRVPAPAVTTMPMQRDPSPLQQLLKDPKVLAIFGLACLMLALLGVGIGAAIVAMTGK